MEITEHIRVAGGERSETGAGTRAEQEGRRQPALVNLRQRLNYESRSDRFTPCTSMIRILLQIVGGVCIVAVFFFATLYYLNSSDVTSRDATRAANVRLLKSALDRYRVAKGKYPVPFPDNPVEDLKAVLVGGGFLKSMPVDPSSRILRYTVGGGSEGKRYALKVPLEEAGDCVTGMGFEGTGWYAPAPPCPF